MEHLRTQLRRNTFVVLGRAGLDLYPEPDGAKIAEAASFRADLGGSAGNIAVALARLGARSSLLSALADDPVGRYTRNVLAGYGVDTAHCRAVGGEARNTLALAETRASDCEVVIYRNGAADFELCEADVSTVAYHEAGALVVTGTALARDPSRTAAIAAMRAARAAGAAVVLDLDYRAYSWHGTAEAGRVYASATRLADVVVGNEEEFAIVDGRTAALDCACGIAERGAALVILKRGRAGAVTLAAGESIRTGVYPVETAKPFGAGDAFMGGLLAALASGSKLSEAVRRGSAAAAIVVSRVGCASAMPTRAELDEFTAANAMPHPPED